MRVTLDLPSSFTKMLSVSEKDLTDFIKVHIALYLYEKEKISFGKARELSGLTVWEFMEKLHENKIPLRYDVEELKEDLKVVNEI